MARPALRVFAVAGVLAVTIGFGGVAAVPGSADPGDSDGTSQESGSTGDGDGGGSEDSGPDQATPGGSGDDPAPPAESGPANEPEQQVEAPRDIDPEPAGPGDGGGDSIIRGEPAVEKPPAQQPWRRPEFENSIKIPFFRFPAAGEIPAGSWPTASTFYTTIVIPVPTLKEFLQALRVVPAPSPAPGPAFRTQEEAPVADAGTGTINSGGIGGGGGGGGASEPVIFRAPLVTVPRAATVAGKPARPVTTQPAGVAAPGGVTQPGVAGVRTPAVRGSVKPTPGVTAAPSVSPTGGQLPQAGAYSRGLANPTVAEIAAVALPGVAGLLFLTFGGGMIGYRQANSVRFVRTAGAERFLP